MHTRLRFAVVLSWSVLQFGCTQGHYVSLIDATNAAQPVFCISTRPECGGSSPSLAFFAIVELKEAEAFRFALNNAVWLSEPADGESTGSARKEVQYGRSPGENWRDRVPPRSLQPATLYGVDNGFYFFWGTKDGGVHSVFYSATERVKAIQHFQSIH